MLETYLSSVIIWMIIIFCDCCIFTNKIIKNGWVDNENKNRKNWLFTLFILSAVPILRVWFACMVIYMANVTKKEFTDKYGEEL